jgi:hypothetical protein
MGPRPAALRSRAIREPDDRDVYWVNVQRRLAESDAAFLTRYDPYGGGHPDHRALIQGPS